MLLKGVFCMNFSFKQTLVISVICTSFFVALFLWALSLLMEDNQSIRSWEQGKYSTTEAVCTDLRLESAGKAGKCWRFTFSDGASVTLPNDARFGFDEEYFRAIMHRPLRYIYAEPSHVLMDIKDGGQSLLNVEYSGKQLYAHRSSSLFFVLLMSPLPIVYIALTVYEVVKHFQKKETRI
jgi:hypothetical protein